MGLRETRLLRRMFSYARRPKLSLFLLLWVGKAGSAYAWGGVLSAGALHWGQTPFSSLVPH